MHIVWKFTLRLVQSEYHLRQKFTGEPDGRYMTGLVRRRLIWRNIVCFNQNVRGLTTKLTYKRYNAEASSGYDVVILTDTRLSGDVLNSELFSQDYCICRFW